MRRARNPRAFVTPRRPIDAAARDGRYQLVFEKDNQFALVRWIDGGWRFANGAAPSFEPTHYRPSLSGSRHG